MSEPLIITEGLTKVFGRGAKRNVAVNNVHLRIQAGQVYGFLGPNGAGKTTTIRMLLNLMYPTQGRAIVFGKDPRRTPEALRRVGFMVEGANFYPYLKAWKNLEVIGRSRGGFNPEQAGQLIRFVGLAGSEKIKVGNFSTGMKQRLGIAAALLNDPDLLILDEPTNGMDPAGIREMRLFIRSLAEQQGKTVFLSSHLLGEVQQTCDRVAIINQGQIIAEGAIDALLGEKTQIEAEVQPVEKAVAALDGKWPITRTASPNVVQIDAKRENIPAIVRTLVNAEVEVFSISSRKQSLEEFFLSITGVPQQAVPPQPTPQQMPYGYGGQPQ